MLGLTPKVTIGEQDATLKRLPWFWMKFLSQWFTLQKLVLSVMVLTTFRR